MRVVFRADASSVIGHGHVVRCLALADALAARGADCEFLCRMEGGAAADAIRSAGHVVRLLAPDDATQAADASATLAALAGWPTPDWLIVDHYRLDAQWASVLRPHVRRVLAIDDLADRPQACDVLLDQNWHAHPEDRYVGLLPPGSVTLFGPEFALLRPAFAQARRSQAGRDGTLRRLLICFGGGDAPDATRQVVGALAPLAGTLVFDVVVGAGYRPLATLRALCDTLPAATVSVDVSDMAQRMLMADLFVGAGGSMTWERASLGLPGITLAIADNQRELSRRLAEAGEGVDLGMLSSDALARLPAAVRILAAAPERLREMGRSLARRCDGMGATRVADRLYGLRAS